MNHSDYKYDHALEYFSYVERIVTAPAGVFEIAEILLMNVKEEITKYSIDMVQVEFFVLTAAGTVVLRTITPGWTGRVIIFPTDGDGFVEDPVNLLSSGITTTSRKIKLSDNIWHYYPNVWYKNGSHLSLDWKVLFPVVVPAGGYEVRMNLMLKGRYVK